MFIWRKRNRGSHGTQPVGFENAFGATTDYWIKMSIAELPPETSTPELKIVKDATCTFCGCVCDDMELTVEDNHITKAKNACVLGKAWFFNHHVEDRPEVAIDGQPATYEEGFDKAAEILLNAKYPITYGLSDSTCEAQRVAVAITDWIGGNLDTTTSVCHGPSGMAFQGVGEVTCSLGEIKNRADYIIFWGGNPAESHPRHFTKYSLMPKGQFVPNGRKDRTAVLIDVRRTKSAKAADIFLQIKPRSDFELAWALRGLAKGLELDPSVEEKTGIPLETLGRCNGRHEEGEVWCDSVWHGGDHDPRQTHQQRRRASAGPRHEPAHPLGRQADARSWQCDRCRQRGDVVDRLSLRREPGTRLSPIQSRGVHLVRLVCPRRG